MEEAALARSREMLMDVENQLNRETDSEEQLPPEKSIKPCIYRMPQRIRKGTEEEFEPQLVSLGPYHFGKPNLAAFEAHKCASLLHSLRRAKKDLKEIEEAVRNIVTDLYYCYDNLWHGWNINASVENFVKLMVVDGCFLVELVRAASQGLYSDNPVIQLLTKSYNIYDVLGDSMLLENQLPLSLLQLLYTILHPERNFKRDAVRGYFVKYSDYIQIMEARDVVVENFDPANFKHWLDYATSYIKMEDPSWSWGPTGGSWKSAVEISNAGVEFFCTPRGKIKFNNGILCLPNSVITRRTKRKLLNAIAYEMLRGGDVMVTDYVIFMANLLKTPEDVNVLCSAGIIYNILENHQAVVDLFNNISHVASGGKYANILNDKINDYCDTKWRRFRAHVKGTYFRSPWAMFSLVYAIILFFFTAGQTYYTVAAYYSSKDGTSPK